MDDTAPPNVVRLIGVYHADGSLLGELRYWVGARLGRAHCALCDVTHGLVRTKPDWTAARARLGVPFDTVHLDERDPDLVEVTDGRTPCVVAETPDGVELVLGPGDLARCDGSVEALLGSLGGALHGRGMVVDGLG